jgi:DNA-binding transcriptional ArsR family regulator
LTAAHFENIRSVEMERFVAMLAALGQAARLEIFRWLVRAGPEGGCVEEIRERVSMPGSTLSHHLDTLRRSGLLTARRDGRFVRYAVDWEAATSLIRFITEDCCRGTVPAARAPSGRTRRKGKR